MDRLIKTCECGCKEFIVESVEILKVERVARLKYNSDRDKHFLIVEDKIIKDDLIEEVEPLKAICKECGREIADVEDYVDDVAFVDCVDDVSFED